MKWYYLIYRRFKYKKVDYDSDNETTNSSFSSSIRVEEINIIDWKLMSFNKYSIDKYQKNIDNINWELVLSNPIILDIIKTNVRDVDNVDEIIQKSHKSKRLMKYLKQL